jgi:hypothetical protein
LSRLASGENELGGGALAATLEALHTARSVMLVSLVHSAQPLWRY